MCHPCKLGWRAGAVLLPALVLTFGCQTARRAGDSDDLLREARVHLEEGSYPYALIKVQGYLQRPWGEKHEEDLALSLAALCNLRLGRAEQSLEYIEELRKRFPESRYNNEQLGRIESTARQTLAAEREKRAQRLEELRDGIARLESSLQENPGNARGHVELGHLYWRAGRYEDALNEYQAGADADESVLQEQELRKRIRIGNNGKLALKDHPVIGQQSGPLQVQRLRVQRDTQRSIRGEIPDRHRIIITGEIHNEDIRDHRDVRMEVAVYDFFERILDVKQLYIGGIPAGGRRPFLAELDRFTGEEFGINRYEIDIYTGDRRTGGAVGN